MKINLPSTMGAMAALIAGTTVKRDELVGTEGVQRIIRDQDRVKSAKAQVRQSTRRAANALVSLGQRQLVLAHLQPRWLRQMVEAKLGAGEDVTFEDVTELRKAGPCAR